MSTKIKICGLTRPEDILYVNRLHPDYIGFVFWKSSKRYVTLEKATELIKHLDPEIKTVGVFVNAPCEQIIEALQFMDVAQLHGEETEENIQYIKAVTGKQVIKAVKVYDRYDVEAWMDSAADYLLFDSGMGSGKTFDWRMLDGVDREFFLAGGLNEDNLPFAIKSCCPYGVDLSSGVETQGMKDFTKMERVMELVKGTKERRSENE